MNTCIPVGCPGCRFWKRQGSGAPSPGNLHPARSARASPGRKGVSEPRSQAAFPGKVRPLTPTEELVAVLFPMCRRPLLAMLPLPSALPCSSVAGMHGSLPFVATKGVLVPRVPLVAVQLRTPTSVTLSLPFKKTVPCPWLTLCGISEIAGNNKDNSMAASPFAWPYFIPPADSVMSPESFLLYK